MAKVTKERYSWPVWGHNVKVKCFYFYSPLQTEAYWLIITKSISGLTLGYKHSQSFWIGHQKKNWRTTLLPESARITYYHHLEYKQHCLTKIPRSWNVSSSKTPASHEHSFNINYRGAWRKALRRLERVFLVAIVFVKRWKIPENDIS